MTARSASSRPLGRDRPYPERTVALPRSVDAITAEWLTEMLARRYPAVVAESLDVLDCRQSHTTKLRVRVAWNQAGTEAGLADELCLKANWSGMRTGRICEREARFYHLIGEGLRCPVPRSYLADWDDNEFGNGLVVMEDLTDVPGAFGLSTDHLGIDGVAAGLESLALVHGSMWGDPRLDGYSWLMPSMGTDNDTEQVRQFWYYITYNLSDPAYREAVPGWVLETPELMSHALDELTAYERALPGPRCLVHGDAHQGNSFLRSDGQRIWLDWQLVRSGSPWRDVSYFIVGALTIEERRAADRELVEHYRSLLVATGAEAVPSAAEAWQHFVRWPAYGTQAWLGNVNQWGQHGGVEMVRRQFAAAADYDTIRLLTAGRTPRRPFVPGEGALGLAPELQAQLGARRG